MVNLKAKIISITISIILLLSALAGGITAIVLNEINKGNATTESDYAVTTNLFNTNGTINSTAVASLLTAINYSSYTARRTGYTAHNLQNRTSNNSGNTIIFPMGYVNGTSGANLYWQATYLYNGYLTVWLDNAYTTSTWNASTVRVNYNSYASSTIQSYLDDTFWPLLTQNSSTLRGIFVTPSQAGYQTLASGTTNDTSYKYSISSSSTTTSSFDNMSTTVGNSSYLWLPSFGEVLNNTSSVYINDTTHYTGSWGLNSTDRSFNRTNYSSERTSYCWLRSGRLNYSVEALVVDSSGTVGSLHVRNFYGVRPATHISLSALQQYARYNVTTAVTPVGAGSASANYSIVVPGTTVTFTATETNPSYRFVGWDTNGDGVADNTTNTLRVTINTDTSYTAIFELITYSVTTSTDGNGSITASTTVTHGESFEVTATPNTSYMFDCFIINNDTNNPIRSNPYTIQNITQNTTITAYFKLKTYTITTSTDGNGSITASATVTHGDNFIVTATHINASYEFDYFILNNDTNNPIYTNPYTIQNITQNTTIVAYFKRAYAHTSATSGGEVRVSGNNLGAEHTSESVSYTAIPYTNYYLIGWFIDGVLYTQNGNTVLDKTITLTQAQAQGTWVVPVFSTNPNGTPTLNTTLENTTAVNSTIGGEARMVGLDSLDTQATLIAKAYENYRFIGWYDGENLLGTDLSIRLNLSTIQNKIIIARFEPITTNSNDQTDSGNIDIL